MRTLTQRPPPIARYLLALEGEKSTSISLHKLLLLDLTFGLMTSATVSKTTPGWKQYFIQETATSYFCFVARKQRDKPCSRTGRLVSEGGNCSYWRCTFGLALDAQKQLNSEKQYIWNWFLQKIVQLYWVCNLACWRNKIIDSVYVKAA